MRRTGKNCWWSAQISLIQKVMSTEADWYRIRNHWYCIKGLLASNSRLGCAEAKAETHKTRQTSTNPRTRKRRVVELFGNTCMFRNCVTGFKPGNFMVYAVTKLTFRKNRFKIIYSYTLGIHSIVSSVSVYLCLSDVFSRTTMAAKRLFTLHY